MLWFLKTLLGLLKSEEQFDHEDTVKRLVAKHSSGNVWLKHGRFLTEKDMDNSLREIKSFSMKTI